MGLERAIRFYASGRAPLSVLGGEQLSVGEKDVARLSLTLRGGPSASGVLVSKLGEYQLTFDDNKRLHFKLGSGQLASL